MNSSWSPRRLHTGRVISTHIRLGALQELQYRTHFWTYLISSLTNVVLALSGVAIVYSQVDDLRGWSRDELLVVVGMFFVVSGVVNGVIHRSLASFASDIRTGEFDYRLLKPVDAHLLSSIRAVDVWRIFDVIAGLGIIGYAMWRLLPSSGAIGASQAVAAPLLLALLLLSLVGFWSIVAGLAFWTTRIEGALWALDEMLDNLRWPISVFPSGLRFALTAIFPAGLAITVPAEALTGRLSLPVVGISILVTVVMLTVARVVWAAGLRRYASASS
jgi:ABC-2 type transport system permease protein